MQQQQQQQAIVVAIRGLKGSITDLHNLFHGNEQAVNDAVKFAASVLTKPDVFSKGLADIVMSQMEDSLYDLKKGMGTADRTDATEVEVRLMLMRSAARNKNMEALDWLEPYFHDLDVYSSALWRADVQDADFAAALCAKCRNPDKFLEDMYVMCMASVVRVAQKIVDRLAVWKCSALNVANFMFRAVNSRDLEPEGIEAMISLAVYVLSKVTTPDEDPMLRTAVWEIQQEFENPDDGTNQDFLENHLAAIDVLRGSEDWNRFIAFFAPSDSSDDN